MNGSAMERFLIFLWFLKAPGIEEFSFPRFYIIPISYSIVEISAP